MLSNSIIEHSWSVNNSAFRCVKQSVEAMLVLANGLKFYGSNSQTVEKTVCPRVALNISSYEPCITMCKQSFHGETNAISNANKTNQDLKDSVMYLTGHWVCCDNCRKVMKQNGVKYAILLNSSDRVINFVDFRNDETLGIMDHDYTTAMKNYKEMI